MANKKEPSKRTSKLVECMLTGLADGQTLTKLAKEQGIHAMTWNRWCREDATLGLAYQESREAGYDAIADDTLNIADTTIARSEHVQLSRLRIDTRMKLLGKWDPKRYGDASTLSVGNKDDRPFEVAPTAEGVAMTLMLAKAVRKGLLSDKPKEDDGEPT